MRTLSMLVTGGLVMAAAMGTNQGCGCGPAKGAYLTSSVLRYDAGGWASQPGLVRGRAFAQAVPIDADQYFVVGGFNAERDGDPASDSRIIELCAVTAGCVIHSEVDETTPVESWVSDGSGVGKLADGTTISATLVVRADGRGGYVTTRAWYTTVLQQGTTVLAQQEDGRIAVLGPTPSRVLGPFAGVLVAAIDASHALVVSDSETLVVDVDSGLVETSAGPGTHVEQAIALGADALVLGYQKARRYDAATRTWRDVPSLAGQVWTIELGLRDGAILSRGDPDAEGTQPYRLYRYRAADDSLVPMLTSPGYDYGATWMEMPDGSVIRVGGARSWFDDYSSAG